MSGNSAAFIGSIPKDYDQGLGPVIFADYARVMAQRAVAGPVSRVLEKRRVGPASSRAPCSTLYPRPLI